LLTDFLNEFPIGYFSADEQGHFVHANATFAEWLGTTLEKLIGGGKRLQEYLAEGSQAVGRRGACSPRRRQGRFCDSLMLLRHRPW
jgi:PAS domain-containing protein